MHKKNENLLGTRLVVAIQMGCQSSAQRRWEAEQEKEWEQWSRQVDASVQEAMRLADQMTRELFCKSAVEPGPTRKNT